MLKPGDVRRIMVEYVVEDALPLSTVDSPAFQKLVSKIPVRPSDKLPDRKTFAKDLDKAYEAMKKELKKKNDAQVYVSVTGGIWSANKKSFIGVTIHWIDAGTLKRQKLQQSWGISRFGLNNKVTACVTDNGSNFVKAFKEFQHAQPESDEEEEEEASQVNFTDLHNVLTTATDDGHSIVNCLPTHRCAAHTLNLSVENHEIDKWLAWNSAP
ncbi:unnamed protein product [Lepeophtheirus salmonis]|uniref:(salmon louse) hypothetical protein n=1 Tax=Lepeophtheirus salmonis TaxID=72036 RepID=A0A7R8HB34_LEPSM|nr:unnamed protein product [Lepeophtheirus salmonis]CAF2985675.1 unnamed protein product [Lepeophtheirus salmonis]